MAGLNPSLINYYFGTKEGLFEAMIRETLEPIWVGIKQVLKESDQDSFIEMLRIYYREMKKSPYFTRLMIQSLQLPATNAQFQIVKQVFLEFSHAIRETLLVKLSNKGVLKEGMDPSFCRISYISLMIFPFNIPASVLSMHNYDLNEEFLDKLFEHNIKVMQHGFLS